MALFGKKTESDSAKATSDRDQKQEKTAGVSTSPETAALSLPLALIQPRISEKAGNLAKLNKYVFLIKKNSNKIEVKKAVEHKYKVRVTQVNIINTMGKTKISGRTKGKRSDFKKAVVTLKSGDSIKGLTDVV